MWKSFNVAKIKLLQIEELAYLFSKNVRVGVVKKNKNNSLII